MTIALLADLWLFFCPTTETVRLRQQLPPNSSSSNSNDTTKGRGTPTYRYEYYGAWANVSPRAWMGAYHAAELPMVMGTHPNFRGASTPAEEATSEAMQDAFAAFARDPWGGLDGGGGGGDGGGEGQGQGQGGQGWDKYTTLGSLQVRGFGYEGVPAQNVQVGTLEAFCAGGTIKT